MSWLVGAGLGFLRAGPLGALVGGAVHHFITKAAKKKVQQRLPGVVDENLFVTCIVVVLAKVAGVKGQITALEVEAIYRFFVKNLDYDSTDLEQINRVIEETLKVNPDLHPVIERFLKAGQGNYRELLLTLAYQIALIEASLNSEMQEGINEIAELLGLSYKAHDQIRKKYALGALVTPYSLLGVEADASQDEIKRAYRKKAIECHPDRVVNEGQVEVEAAHVRFLEIQEAYRKLRSEV